MRDCLIGASSKCGIFETWDYVNTALSQCGIAVFLTLILTLASCKNRNAVVTRVSCLSIEPLQVVYLGTGSSLKLDPSVLPENQTTAGGLPGNWLWFKSKVLFSNW